MGSTAGTAGTATGSAPARRGGEVRSVTGRPIAFAALLEQEVIDQQPGDPPLLRTDVLSMEDLKPGMELMGTVRNVIDFGAFVDVGVHQDGLVHISQICDRYIKHPSEVLKVGDIVKVWVLSVDMKKKRISLTMRQAENRV